MLIISIAPLPLLLTICILPTWIRHTKSESDIFFISDTFKTILNIGFYFKIAVWIGGCVLWNSQISFCSKKLVLNASIKAFWITIFFSPEQNFISPNKTNNNENSRYSIFFNFFCKSALNQYLWYFFFVILSYILYHDAILSFNLWTCYQDYRFHNKVVLILHDKQMLCYHI